MDITWEYETAAAERRAAMAAQAREDKESGMGAWLEFVATFTREAVMSRVIRPLLRVLRGHRGPDFTVSSPVHSAGWYLAEPSATMSSITLDLI